MSSIETFQNLPKASVAAQFRRENGVASLLKLVAEQNLAVNDLSQRNFFQFFKEIFEEHFSFYSWNKIHYKNIIVLQESTHYDQNQ